jgi:hypothetical protein
VRAVKENQPILYGEINNPALKGELVVLVGLLGMYPSQIIKEYFDKRQTKELSEDLGESGLGARGTLVNFCIFMQKFRLTRLLWEFVRYKYS